MPKDLLLDEDLGLIIRDGDLVIGESTQQHQACLLIADEGNYLFAPLAPVGLQKYLLDDDLEGAKQEIVKKFELDGMKVRRITLTETDVSIDASYD